VRAAGTFSELQGSGFSFGLEAAEGDRHTAIERHGQSPDHRDRQGSINRWKRQNSDSSQVVTGTAACITVTVHSQLAV
jgi:hypothetical protein